MLSWMQNECFSKANKMFAQPALSQPFEVRARGRSSISVSLNVAVIEINWRECKGYTLSWCNSFYASTHNFVSYCTVQLSQVTDPSFNQSSCKSGQEATTGNSSIVLFVCPRRPIALKWSETIAVAPHLEQVALPPFNVSPKPMDPPSSQDSTIRIRNVYLHRLQHNECRLCVPAANYLEKRY